MSDLIERLDAASRDDRLADGMLYREAKDALEAMQTRVAELEALHENFLTEFWETNRRNSELEENEQAAMDKTDEVRHLLKHALRREETLRAEVTELKKLLAVARCPNTDCKEGTFPYDRNPDGGWLFVECQWCAELKQALKGEDDGVD